MSTVQQRQMALAQQIGGLLGQMLVDALNNPQAEAQRRAEEEARQAELQRFAAEEERRKEAMKERILAMLQGVGPAPNLTLMGVGPAPTLSLMGMDSGSRQPQTSMVSSSATTFGELPAGSAMAQLTSAAYYSDLAVKASSDEEATALAEAAFDSTSGAPVDIPVPPSAPALPVQDADISRIDATRNQYLDAQHMLDASLAKAADLERQRALLQQVTNDNEAHLTAAERSRVNEQSRMLIANLDRQIADERAKARVAQMQVGSSAGAILDLGDYLRKRNSIAPAPTRQPDKDSYLRGIEDAALCRPSSGALYCGELKSQSAIDACRANYDNGYHVGERRKENKLREAYAIGQEAKRSNNRSIGFNHPKSVGPCRNYWLNAYDSGLQGTPFTMTGR